MNRAVFLLGAAVCTGVASAEIVTVDFQNYEAFVGLNRHFDVAGVSFQGDPVFRNLDGDIGVGGATPDDFWSLAIYGRDHVMRLVSFTVADLGGAGVADGLRVSGASNNVSGPIGLTYVGDVGNVPVEYVISALEGTYVERLFFTSQSELGLDDYVITSVTLDIVVPAPAGMSAVGVAGVLASRRRRR